MTKQAKKRGGKPRKTSKPAGTTSPPETPAPDNKDGEQDFGGMNLENFKRNLGCG